MLDEFIVVEDAVLIVLAIVRCSPCGLRGCKNRPAPFPGWMSYKATKPGSVS